MFARWNPYVGILSMIAFIVMIVSMYYVKDSCCVVFITAGTIISIIYILAFIHWVKEDYNKVNH